LIPGLLGFLAGAVLFGLTYQQVFPQISTIANLGNVVIPGLWNLNPYLSVLVFSMMALILFYLIDRAGLQRKDKDENKDQENKD
jgi:membrane protein implicated in regulation of membrane protease activity